MDLSAWGGIGLEVLLAAVGVIATLINLKMRSVVTELEQKLRDRIDVQMNTVRAERRGEIEALRRELACLMPQAVALEKLQSVGQRIQYLEVKHKENQDNIHKLRGRVTELVLGKMSMMETTLVDKARRMGTLEEKMRTQEMCCNDLQNRIQAIERRRQ